MRSFRVAGRAQAFRLSLEPIWQHFTLERDLLRTSLCRMQLRARFATWHRFTEFNQEPAGF
jgi:hypothetical protein